MEYVFGGCASEDGSLRVEVFLEGRGILGGCAALSLIQCRNGRQGSQERCPGFSRCLLSPMRSVRYDSHLARGLRARLVCP